VGGDRPRRRLPGAEAATEEAAAAVIRCHVLLWDVVMLCFWFGGGVNYSIISYSGREWMLWCVGYLWDLKNDGCTLSITNAGVKSPTFKK
jgi:hypothetical protein